jgi:uncharacterized protein (DUF983 family)
MDDSLFALVHSCPRCHRAPLFASFLKLHPACHACGQRFQEEPGQNWGALVMAYGMGAVVSLPLFLVLLAKRYDTPVVLGVPALVLLVLSPLTMRLSRLAWAHALFHLHGGRR